MTKIGSTATVHFLEGRIDGPRIVESRTSPLRVFASDWSELPSLMAGGLPPSAGIYFLTGPAPASPRLAVRPGEALDLRRRLSEHALDPTKASFSEVFAVSATDDRLSKFDCRYLEARAHEIVGQLPGHLLEVEKIPAVAACPPHERDVLESLLVQARLLLHAAGCRALDAPNMAFIGTAEQERDDGIVEIQADTSGNVEDEHELSYDGIWARGHPASDGGFIVRAGSDIRRREGAALLPGIQNRRRMLGERGVLSELPGIVDRWRLIANLYCSSQLLAAKIVTGAHVSNRGIWQRISPSARIIVAR